MAEALDQRYGYRAGAQWIDAANTAIDLRGVGDGAAVRAADDALWALYVASDSGAAERRVQVLWDIAPGEGLLRTPVGLIDDLLKTPGAKNFALFAFGATSSMLASFEGRILRPVLRSMAISQCRR